MAADILPAPVRPANPVHALHSRLFAAFALPADNDIGNPDWTAHPLARRLLASFATTPPPVTTLDRHQRWDSRDTVYTGFRVACLRVIRTSVVNTAFLAAEAAGRMDEAARIAAAVTVDEAIDAAIRIPTLPTFAIAARQLDPAAWGVAL